MSSNFLENQGPGYLSANTGTGTQTNYSGPVISNCTVNVPAPPTEGDTKSQIEAWLKFQRETDSYIFENSIKQWLQDTCDWFLHRKEFKEWSLDTSSQDNAKLLWIHGAPGFGKTILCARVIDHLIKKPKISVASFFFSAGLESHRDPVSAIRSWISQMALDDEVALRVVESNWKVSGEQWTPTKEAVLRMFAGILKRVPQYTFVLDGLDECKPEQGSSMSIAEFLDTIKKLFANTRTKIMIVSRNEAEIRNSLGPVRGLDVVEYQLSRTDTENDLKLYSKSLVGNQLAGQSEERKRRTVKEMTDRSDGQFIWLKLQEDALKRASSVDDIRNVIAENPVGLDQLYNRHWDKINSLPHCDKAQVLSLLLWATYASEPLTAGQITEAMLVPDKFHKVPFDTAPESVDADFINLRLTNFCRSFLSIHMLTSKSPPASWRVQLAHFTAREFLQSKISSAQDMVSMDHAESPDPRSIHSLLARMCLQYIITGDSRRKHDRSSWGKSFENYANHYWYRHAGMGMPDDADTVNLANRLFDTANPNWTRWKIYFDAKEPLYTKSPEGLPLGPLYYASGLGLVETVRYLLNQRNAPSYDGSAAYALMAACATGDIPVATLLLEKAVNIKDAYEITGTSPLTVACDFRRLSVMKLLLEKGASLKVSDGRGFTPLHSAAYQGDLEAVKLLLEKGADTMATDNLKHTALSLAIHLRHTKIVKLLLEKEYDVSGADLVGCPAWFVASCFGDLGTVDLLLEKGVDVMALERKGLTPLHAASFHGELEIVKLLLQRNADIMATDLMGVNPFTFGVASGEYQGGRASIKGECKC